MLEPIDGLPDGVIGLRAVGRVTGEDYAATLTPAIERAGAAGRPVRLLLELGEAYEGYDPSAIVADAGLGAEHFRAFERLAVVTDHEWIRRGIQLFGPLIPGEVRVYAVADAEGARAWVAESSVA